MNQRIIIILLILFTCQTYAQKGEAILILKDSTRINGKGGVYANSLLLNPKFGNDTLKYKFYNSEEIIGIDILENDYYRQFRYKDENKYQELVEVVLIDNLSLYIRVYEKNFVGSNLARDLSKNDKPIKNDIFKKTNKSLLPYFINNIISENRYSYYVGNGVNDHIEHIYTEGLPFSLSFKKAMKRHFKDCPLLIEKVENKEFSKKQLWKVLEFYNSECLKLIVE